MPVKQISNPAGAFGNTADPSAQIVEEYVNNSGGTLIAGDVVVSTDVAGVLATTTTTASDVNVIGVVAPLGGAGGALGAAVPTDTYAAGAMIPVITRGPARVNIGSNTVAAGAVLSASGTAKVAAVAGTAASVAALQALVGSFIAIAKEAQTAKDASNTIRCYVQKM